MCILFYRQLSLFKKENRTKTPKRMIPYQRIFTFRGRAVFQMTTFDRTPRTKFRNHTRALNRFNRNVLFKTYNVFVFFFLAKKNKSEPDDFLFIYFFGGKRRRRKTALATKDRPSWRSLGSRARGKTPVANGNAFGRF